MPRTADLVCDTSRVVARVQKGGHGESLNHLWREKDRRKGR